jgi:PAS domain S-box-containing protein
LAAILDISELKQAETQHLRLVTAIEQSTEAVFITDTDFTILYANPAFERMCGYDRREIIGLHARVLENKNHNRQFYRAIRTALEQGHGWSGQMTCTKKDGTTYEAEVASAPVRDRNGKVINYVSTHKDITHELRLEEELRQAQKMEAIGTLAGGIAHDFNNILAAIMGNAELLLHRLPPKSRDQQHLNRILISCNRAADLVQQILTFSRKSKQERKPLHLTPIIKETLRLLRSTLPSNIEIQRNFYCRPDEDVTLADPTQVHQILMNLCTNAAHAIGAESGVMEITLSSITVDEQLIASRYAGVSPGRYVCLTVSDTGPGIVPDVLQRIFDPYFTTKGVGKGTGLGLAVVKGIVASYNGAITVSSEPGFGTTFTLLFPEERETFDQKSPAPSLLSSGRGRILLVDDEEMLVQVGGDILAALGYEVVTKTSSLDALELFLQQPEAFDLVMTDMTMPGMTGKELIKKILAVRPDIPVVLCTGFSDFVGEQHVKPLGISAFIRKPYTIETLAQAIQSTLRVT